MKRGPSPGERHLEWKLYFSVPEGAEDLGRHKVTGVCGSLNKLMARTGESFRSGVGITLSELSSQ